MASAASARAAMDVDSTPIDEGLYSRQLYVVARTGEGRRRTEENECACACAPSPSDPTPTPPPCHARGPILLTNPVDGCRVPPATSWAPTP